MKIRFLGTGTSTGVPQLRCGCEVCRSTDPRDKRMRCAAIVTTDDGNNILIDCGPDIYQQLLAADSPQLSCLLLTHIHYDHTGGIDDLRPYSAEGKFDVYCRSDVEAELRVKLPYCFVTELYPGVANLAVHTIAPYVPFKIGTTEILPVEINHYKLDILGFRIGRLGYVTDCKVMPERTIDALRGVDTLVINALRHEPHVSHITLNEALDLIERIAPRQAFLTHIAHQMGLHSHIDAQLPCGVHMAYDGLEITF